jgi:acyl-coenzyme A synthetase/AMP-(fatty) acid ligase
VPEEVETSMADKTGLECALIGLPDQKLGQRLVLVAEKCKIPIQESIIMAELQKLLPHKLQPKEILWVKKLPRNNAFKLDRQKLTDLVYRSI